MAPSASQMEQHQQKAITAAATMTSATITTTTSVSNDPWCTPNQQQKENLRPPVFFPEDYITALKKFSKFGSSGSCNGNANKSIYDTIDEAKNEKANTTNAKSRTLPLSKNSEYKWVQFRTQIDFSLLNSFFSLALTLFAQQFSRMNVIERLWWIFPCM
jgi:hypothetical protein